MAYWYEVFDNEQVQLVTRRRAAKLFVLLLVMGAASMALLALGRYGLVPLPLVGFLLGLGWAAVLWWSVRRLRELRCVVWCVKLSDRHIVGYDYARRKLTLDWTRAERVVLDGSGLLVTGEEGALYVSHLFPEFATLSHRLCHYAEFYDVALFIDDQPFYELDVYDLYPFLSRVATADGEE